MKLQTLYETIWAETRDSDIYDRLSRLIRQFRTAALTEKDSSKLKNMMIDIANLIGNIPIEGDLELAMQKRILSELQRSYAASSLDALRVWGELVHKFLFDISITK